MYQYGEVHLIQWKFREMHLHVLCHKLSLISNKTVCNICELNDLFAYKSVTPSPNGLSYCNENSVF